MPCLMLVACIYLCHSCNDANLMQTQFYLYLFIFIFLETFMKKLTLVALAAMMVLTGCNTISGFGQDVSKAGDTVSDTANDVKQKI